MERRKAGKRKRIKRWLLLIDFVLLCVLIYALVRLVLTLVDYRRSARRYDELAGLVVSTSEPAEAPAAPTAPGETAGPTDAPSEVPIQVDFAALQDVE